MADRSKDDVRILIADDSDFMRMIIKGMLQKMGYIQILTASTGNDAVQLCKVSSDASCPDIALLDINMEDGDGISALKQIKEINPKIKCMIVSAIDQRELVEEAKRYGAVDYIKKPFQADRLKLAIENALKR